MELKDEMLKYLNMKCEVTAVTNTKTDILK